MKKKHYIVYWDENLEKYYTTNPRDWARLYGKKYGLEEDARTRRIEDVLKNEFRFVEFTFDTSIVLCNLNTFTPNF